MTFTSCEGGLGTRTCLGRTESKGREQSTFGLGAQEDMPQVRWKAGGGVSCGVEKAPKGPSETVMGHPGRTWVLFILSVLLVSQGRFPRKPPLKTCVVPSFWFLLLWGPRVRAPAFQPDVVCTEVSISYSFHMAQAFDIFMTISKCENHFDRCADSGCGICSSCSLRHRARCSRSRAAQDPPRAPRDFRL